MFNNALFCSIAFLVGVNLCLAQTGSIPSEDKKKEQTVTHVCQPVITIQPNGFQQAEIPRRLFQTWKTHALPRDFAAWSQTWKAHHPQWEFELWDDAENRAFIQTYYSWFLTRYDSYPKEIFRADAVRYFYLYHYGGIYADLDFECLKSVEPLLSENCVILGRMSDHWPEHNIPNAFMASPPRAEFWLVVIHCLMNAPANPQPEHMTGPVILHKAVLCYKDKKKRQMILDQMQMYIQDAVPIAIQIRPPCELYPYEWTIRRYEKLPCSYAVTWWVHSW